MHRVVITGRGVVSPIGSDVDTFLTSLDTNVVGIAPAPWSNDESFGWWACVTDFDPLDWMSPKVEEGTDLFAQFAIAATEQSVNESGIGELPARRTAIVHGSSMGGLRALMKGQHDLDCSGEFDRKMMIQVLPNMAASQLAMRYELHGPQLTVTTACASSVDAIGLAAGMIQRGEVDVALVGATEGGLPSWDGTMEGDFCPVWYDAHARYGMSAQGRDPRRAMIPFDIDRQGIVTGDGSAALVLESEQHARERGAHVFAEFGGHATLADAYHPSSPDPTGQWEAEVMRDAIAAAGVDATDVDALYAHGTATPKGDIAEIQAVNAVHGGRNLPVTSIKGHTGHTGAASAMMSAIAAIHTIADGTLPNTAGTRNLEPAAEFRIVVTEPAKLDAAIVQINAFGFGGQNSSMLLRRYA